MTLEEIENQVQQLRQDELLKFAEWFDVYRDANVLFEEDIATDLTSAQREELRRRKAEFLQNPSVATPWNDGFFDRLRQRLTDARNQKA